MPMDESDIQREYERLGYGLGWFFMLTREERLGDARVATVGLNPGGKEAEKPAWACACGNAYFCDPWGPNASYIPIQQQMHALYRIMEWDRDEVLAAQYVPFRSPSWASLPRRREALAFSRRLWRWVLAESPARTFVCLGKVAAAEMVALTGAHPDGEFAAGWGALTIDRYVAPDGKVIVKWPHPSRYLLFDRPHGRSEAAVASMRAALRAP